MDMQQGGAEDGMSVMPRNAILRLHHILYFWEIGARLEKVSSAQQIDVFLNFTCLPYKLSHR